MVIGILKCEYEHLAPVVPAVVAKFIKEDFQVLLESGAGLEAGYSDEAYHEAGAKEHTRVEVLEKSDILITFSGFRMEDFKFIKKSALLIGKFDARGDSTLTSSLRKAPFSVISLDLLPRTTIAQSMDVMSSLASISGYKSAIVAADHFGGYLPMMTTSAGTLPPAKVLVLGAGVGGLQAIATARRLGAVVQAFDVRSSVKEEVESLGAKFIEVQGGKEDLNAGGYAIEQTEDYQIKQKELIYETAIKSDIIITTANIPGRQAPLLVEEQTVVDMKPGSVIVDLAAETGGNCALTENDAIISVHGVKIVGDSRLYNQMAHQASLVYSNNVHSFLKYLLKDDNENISFDDELVDTVLLKVKETSAISA